MLYGGFSVEYFSLQEPKKPPVVSTKPVTKPVSPLSPNDDTKTEDGLFNKKPKPPPVILQLY